MLFCLLAAVLQFMLVTALPMQTAIQGLHNVFVKVNTDQVAVSIQMAENVVLVTNNI